MGVIRLGILGGFTGKVGAVIGAIVNGECIITSLHNTSSRTDQSSASTVQIASDGDAPGVLFAQVSSASKDAEYSKQDVQRTKMILVTAFLRPIVPYLRLGFQEKAINKTEYNIALAYNIKHAAMEDEEGNKYLAFSKALVSMGNLPNAVHDASLQLGRNSVDFIWTNNSELACASDNDISLPLLFNTDNLQAVYDLEGARRHEERTALRVPAHWRGNTMVAFLAFASEDRKRTSNSIYLGSFLAQ